MKLKKIKALVFFFFVCINSFCQEIAITFDDAPTGNGPLFTGLERTEKLLAHLREGKVTESAFFVITKNIDSREKERLAKYAKAGHLISNHTESHTSIKDLGTAQYIAGIASADSTLRLMAGFAPYFRYPFLDEGKTRSSRDSIRSALAVMGLQNGYVTVDNYDWYINHLLKQAIAKGKKPDMTKLKDLYIEHIWRSIIHYDNIAKQYLGRSPRHVLLLHENDLAASFLGELISHIRNQGWKIIPVSEAYADPIAAHTPDVLFNGQGRVAAIANEKGGRPRDLVQDSEDEVYLEEIVKSRNIFK